MSRIDLFKQHLQEKRAVKVIAGIDNFDMEKVRNVVEAATQGGAHAVDICFNKEIFDMFGEGQIVSSTKGHTGHLLGAAGAVEAIYSILTLETGQIPPTANLETPLPEGAGLDLVKGVAREKVCQYVLSNSFGFGGTNGSLILRKVA